jgi:hypothetical protein
MRNVENSVCVLFLFLALAFGTASGQSMQPVLQGTAAGQSSASFDQSSFDQTAEVVQAETSTTTTALTVPSTAKVISNIQKLTGWKTCVGTCAGMPHAVYSLTLGVTSPSLSGASAKAQILSGTSPFGGVMWYKYLTAGGTATHFVYDFYFYMTNPSAPQALEFNISQSTGGYRYEFASQCELVNTRTWRLWDPSAKHWVGTTVPCLQPPPKTWNHVTWELQRSGSSVIFVAITLNGTRHVLNKTVARKPDGSSGIDFGFQLDANRTATPFALWLDKVTLKYW